jgi:hypothetical protein
MPERRERHDPRGIGQEQTRYHLANSAAEVMYGLFEAEYQQEGEDYLEVLMRRLKDLSAYSLRHAEIMVQREGVELLALAKFFGMTTDPAFHRNQARLHLLSEEVLTYQGQAEVIEQEVAARNTSSSPPKKDDQREIVQPRLF